MGVFDLVLTQLQLFLLLSARMTGLFLVAPVFSNRLVPVQLRVAIGFAAALLVLPLFGPQDLPPELLSMAFQAAREMLVGLVIGYVAQLLFAALQFGGELLDIDMGFSMMNVLDPMSNAHMPLMGNLQYLVALLTFLIANGHHMLIWAVVESYEQIPLGTGALNGPLADHLVSAMTGVFVVGIKVAAPALAALFISTVTLGIINRAVPQMNVFVVGMPVKLAVGLFISAAALPIYVYGLQGLFDAMFRDVAEVIRLLS